MDAPNAPFVDHAAPILAGDPALSDEHRADLWDTFHSSKSPEELEQRLQTMAVPLDDTKQKLLKAKQISMPALDPHTKIEDAIQRMTKLEPEALNLAESHPNVLKAFTSAAADPEKASAVPASASKAPAKGNTPAKAKVPAGLTPDVPATPPGHALVKASDGAMYHVPHANIDQARTLDPKLQVLHVEP